MEKERLWKRIQVARKELAPDLVLAGGQVVNVYTGALMKADVALFDGVIAGLGDYEGPRVDVQGKFICPGLIDGHLHLESTMLTPREFARAVVPLGTTAVVADPHEIANVLGTGGLDYMLEASEGLPLDIFFMLPSCVPATHLETAGASLGPDDLTGYRTRPRVLGLAEMMNFPGVLFGDTEVLEKLSLFIDGRVDGHAPLLSGPDLQAYRLAGIGSDHECTQLPEAQEKLALGFRLMIREGSQAKNLTDLLPAITRATQRRVMLVTDDCHPYDLLQVGHINHLLQKAVSLGLDPVTAITLATLNPAEYFHLRRRGALAPGFLADLIVVDDLSTFKVDKVFKNGQLVAEQGHLLSDVVLPDPTPMVSAFQVSTLQPESFQIAVQDNRVKVIQMVPDQLLTHKAIIPTPAVGGLVCSAPHQDVLKLAVIERHRHTGNIGLGLVQGFGLKNGALASSVAHDSHNVVCVGVNDHDMFIAVQHLISRGGGLVVVAEGRVRADLPLPLAGLMSLESLEKVAAQHSQVTAASRDLGGTLPDPFMVLSFLALPVIPELKLTDLGLVDVNRFQVVSLFGED